MKTETQSQNVTLNGKTYVAKNLRIDRRGRVRGADLLGGRGGRYKYTTWDGNWFIDAYAATGHRRQIDRGEGFAIEPA